MTALDRRPTDTLKPTRRLYSSTGSATGSATGRLAMTIGLCGALLTAVSACSPPKPDRGPGGPGPGKADRPAAPVLEQAVPDAASVCGNRPCLRIGSMNVERLGTPTRSVWWQPGKVKRLRTRDEVAKIARLLKEKVNADLLAIQETDVKSPQFAWFKKELEAGPAGYKMLPPISQSWQSIVIAYKPSKLVALGRQIKIPIDYRRLPRTCRWGFTPRPLAAKFRVRGIEITFVAAHPTSMHIAGKPAAMTRLEAQSCNIQKRLAETRSIARWIDRNGVNDTVIIAGDLNDDFYSPLLRPLRQRGRWALTLPNNIWKGSNGVSYLAPGFQGILDHIIVGPKLAPLFVPRSTVIMPVGDIKTYRPVFSDHAPIWAVIYLPEGAPR